MNKIWLKVLTEGLEAKKSSGLYRSLRPLEENQGRFIRINGQQLINFASNDYLGLANDPRIIEAGFNLSRTWGAGAGASRLISGSYQPLSDLEERFADWAGKEKALIYNSGYHANIGVISALADRKTLIFTDKLNHASIYDGIVLSRAQMIRYPHNDPDSLKALLEKHKTVSRKIIVTDAVFSMDGDRSQLEKITALAHEYDTLTIVDEAHSFGLFGRQGNGWVNELNLNKQIDILIGTLGKSFGVFGAFVLADQQVIDYLINHSRPFIFTTALPPFVTGAVNCSLSLIQQENRGAVTLQKAAGLRDRLNQAGINTGTSSTQIIPVITGTNANALNLTQYLQNEGFFAPAIRPPTVPQGASRIRLSISYHHIEEELNRLGDVLIHWFKKKY